MLSSQQDRPHIPASSLVWTEEGHLRGSLVGAGSGAIVSATCELGSIADIEMGEDGTFLLHVPDPLLDEMAHELVLEPPGGETLRLSVILDPVLRNQPRTGLKPIGPDGIPLRAGEPLVSIPPTAETVSRAPGEGAVAPASPDHFTRMLDALHVQTEALRVLLQRTARQPDIVDGTLVAPPGGSSAAERYGSLVEEASYRPDGRDVVWLGVIDWNFRIQRPQHLAAGLAKLGSRVLYVSIVFGQADGKSLFTVVGTPAMGVFEVRLKLTGVLPPNIYGGFTDEQVGAILAALDEASLVLGVQAPVVVVQYPSWHPVAVGIPGATVVHDCLDLVSGFENVPAAMVALESKLVLESDLVVTSSAPLQDHVAAVRSSTVIRNGADVEFFAKARAIERAEDPRGPVIGYFGAIAHWFQVAWIARAAAERPDWTFLLIGSTDGADVESLRALSNVRLLGERPYAELPTHLAQFDVAVIPFKLLDLILCTNPVKLYEYMAGGKPVVASAMPEVIAATDLVYIAADADGFVSELQRALDEDTDELRQRRMAWAQAHSWANRSHAFECMIAEAEPKVSLIVLSYNNWSLTSATLWSILAHSEYANLEIVVVDNGSTDCSPRELEQFAKRDPRIKLILSQKNLGYAAGNNLGLRASTGDYLVLLNNDIYVTKGWVRDLIRPLRMDPSLGLVSPLTNNIGNEQKVSIHYIDMQEMARESRKVVRRHKRGRYETDSVAFFCVALPRKTLDKVGYLDEAYGLGFFEDDDYCKRVRQAGYRIQIVDDAFIHHHLSASFDALGTAHKRAQMERNKALFEERWGEWKPHRYRDAPGFGSPVSTA